MHTSLQHQRRGLHLRRHRRAALHRRHAAPQDRHRRRAGRGRRGRPARAAARRGQSDYDTGSLVFKTYGEEAVYYFLGAMDYDAIHFNYREYILGFQPLAYFVANMTAQGTVVVVEANLNWATQREFRDLTIPAFTTFNYSGGDLVGFTAGINGDLSTLLSFPQNTSASNEVAGIRRAVGIMQNMGVNKIIVAVSSNFVLTSGNPPPQTPTPHSTPFRSFFFSSFFFIFIFCYSMFIPCACVCGNMFCPFFVVSNILILAETLLATNRSLFFRSGPRAQKCWSRCKALTW
jgi:hypothetical protein